MPTIKKTDAFVKAYSILRDSNVQTSKAASVDRILRDSIKSDVESNTYTQSIVVSKEDLNNFKN